jgi:hypothetical protein
VSLFFTHLRLAGQRNIAPTTLYFRSAQQPVSSGPVIAGVAFARRPVPADGGG